MSKFVSRKIVVIQFFFLNQHKLFSLTFASCFTIPSPLPSTIFRKDFLFPNNDFSPFRIACIPKRIRI